MQTEDALGARGELRRPVVCEPSVVDQVGALASVLDPRVNVAIHPRRLPEHLTGGLRGALALDFENQVRVRCGRDDDLQPLLQPMDSEPARAFVTRDAMALVSVFAGMLGRRAVWARFAVVSRDSCRKLHSDSLPLRLICTYAGPGTQWVADADVDRAPLAQFDRPIECANRAAVRIPGGLRSAKAGDVLVLKGEEWPGFAGRGAVHRSPPVEAAGLRRLVLTLDVRPRGC